MMRKISVYAIVALLGVFVHSHSFALDNLKELEIANEFSAKIQDTNMIATLDGRLLVIIEFTDAKTVEDMLSNFEFVPAILACTYLTGRTPEEKAGFPTVIEIYVTPYHPSKRYHGAINFSHYCTERLSP